MPCWEQRPTSAVTLTKNFVAMTPEGGKENSITPNQHADKLDSASQNRKEMCTTSHVCSLIFFFTKLMSSKTLCNGVCIT